MDTVALPFSFANWEERSIEQLLPDLLIFPKQPIKTHTHKTQDSIFSALFHQFDHIYQNKWQLTLQGQPARPREGEEKISLEAHPQLEASLLAGFCPSQISELASSLSALQPEPIAKDLAKPSPAEGAVSELFVSLR